MTVAPRRPFQFFSQTQIDMAAQVPFVRPLLLGLGLCLFAVVLDVPPVAAQTEQTPRSLNEPLTEEEKQPLEEAYIPPEKIVEEAFEAPPGAKSLSKRKLWIDREKQRVYFDGYVAMQDGPLEMFACPMGTKEHESIVASLARSSEVHAALLAIGAKPGTPVQYLPNFIPATGQRIRIWVCFYDGKDQFQAIDARRWVRKAGTEEQMETDWVFAGSGFWKDPSDGREYYRADGGDMICVSNFSTAMLDVPFASSAEANDLLFAPFSKRIPVRGTPVRLVLMPIPIPTDVPPDPDKAESTKSIDPDQAPTEEILPRKPKANQPRSAR